MSSIKFFAFKFFYKLVCFFLINKCDGDLHWLVFLFYWSSFNAFVLSAYFVNLFAFSQLQNLVWRDIAYKTLYKYRVPFELFPVIKLLRFYFESLFQCVFLLGDIIAFRFCLLVFVFESVCMFVVSSLSLILSALLRVFPRLFLSIPLTKIRSLKILVSIVVLSWTTLLFVNMMSLFQFGLFTVLFNKRI